MLGDDQRAVIEPASVIGLNFMRPALNELVVDAVRPEVNSHLTTLTQKQLIPPPTGRPRRTTPVSSTS